MYYNKFFYKVLIQLVFDKTVCVVKFTVQYSTLNPSQFSKEFENQTPNNVTNKSN